jgi:hypothetical protein
LLVLLYRHEAWSVTLREDLNTRALESRMLRIIFGPKRKKVIGGWRKLHNEDLSNL